MKRITSSMTFRGKAASDFVKILMAGHSANTKEDSTMSKRIKPVADVPSIHSLEEADALLARMAARKREVALLNLGLQEDIDRLKLVCEEQAEPIKQDICGMEQALLRFAESRKDELFSKKKSRDLTFGVIGFRAASTLKTLKKAITWERVLGTLNELKMTSCIRTKEEVDKDELRKLSPEKLAEVGCKMVQEDSFYYELAEQELADTSSV